MNVQIIVPPEREGISFREIGFTIAEALRKVRPTINVSVDPWTKNFVPNIILTPTLGFATWDLLIFPMTVAPNATTLFSYYSNPFMSKKAWYYGAVEGKTTLNSIQKAWLSGRVVAPSNFAKEMLEQDGIKVKEVIPHGFNPESFTFNAPLVRCILERFRGKKLLYYLSSGVKRKGIVPLLKAMVTVKKHHKDIVLHLDVLPQYVEQYSAIAQKLGVSDVVAIDGDFGNMSREHIAANYYAADVYVHPSFSGAFEMPIVESMLCLKAPIVVDAPPMNEHVDESCGWLVPFQKVEWEDYLGIMHIKNHIFNPEDMAEKIIYALDHPGELKEKGCKAYQKALEKYHYIKTYKRFLEL